jgi:uncharacterized protein YraI
VPADGAEPAGSTESDLSGAYPVGTDLFVTAGVTFRKTPSINGSILGRIPSGSTVKSASSKPQAGWYGVTFEGNTGWVSGQYLSRASGTGSGTGGPYGREQVYDLIVSRGQSIGAASDVLDPSKTTQDLVNAIGWLATHSPPAWGFSVINTGHHYDPEAHSGGFAIDFFATDPADDARFMSLVDQDPYFVEIGVTGDYNALRGSIRSKCTFQDSGDTHVHASVRRAFC